MINAILNFLRDIFRDKPAIERPSSPEIFLTPDYAWTGAAYADSAGRKRIKANILLIPFQEDPEVYFSTPSDTNSEDPVMDAGNHALCIQPFTEDDRVKMCQWIEDIFNQSKGMLAPLCVYRKADGGAIGHRVSRVSRDTQGRLWQFTGDNNQGIADSEPVRDSQIHAIIGGVDY